MKKTNFHGLWRWLGVTVILLSVALLIRWEAPPPQDFKSQARRLSASQAFNFITWELEALARKVAFSLAAPHHLMDEATRSRYVLEYLDQVREARHLNSEIERAYTDPEIEDPDAATAAQQARLRELRRQMRRSSLVAEAILSEQVSSVLQQGGFGTARRILPPVSATFTPLPHLLVVSPRTTIESVYQRPLLAGMTAAAQDELESLVESELPSYSAYVTGIGGLAAYPAMLLESSSIDWISDVIAHEWTHHYLVFYPLGMYYDRSGETRTINETAASLMGEWAGQAVILRYYAPLLEREKALPNPLVASEGERAEPPAFDFRAEMHHTRVIVDAMLAEGKIREAEWYMEAQRRYFVANGYRLRKLNQAYFAFHGAYASGTGAAGKDPIGPRVRELWAISPSPRAFARALGPATTLAELQAAEARLTGDD